MSQCQWILFIELEGGIFKGRMLFHGKLSNFFMTSERGYSKWKWFDGHCRAWKEAFREGYYFTGPGKINDFAWHLLRGYWLTQSPSHSFDILSLSRGKHYKSFILPKCWKRFWLLADLVFTSNGLFLYHRTRIGQAICSYFLLRCHKNISLVFSPVYNFNRGLKIHSWTFTLKSGDHFLVWPCKKELQGFVHFNGWESS